MKGISDKWILTLDQEDSLSSKSNTSYLYRKSCVSKFPTGGSGVGLKFNFEVCSQLNFEHHSSVPLQSLFFNPPSPASITHPTSISIMSIPPAVTTITDKLNNTLTTFASMIREIQFKHHNGQLIKRRKMLQRREYINQAKAQHHRRKLLKIESRKAALRELFGSTHSQ
jgi:hypothetical protein